MAMVFVDWLIWSIATSSVHSVGRCRCGIASGEKRILGLLRCVTYSSGPSWLV